jgi:hypothetical protein
MLKRVELVATNSCCINKFLPGNLVFVLPWKRNFNIPETVNSKEALTSPKDSTGARPDMEPLILYGWVLTKLECSFLRSTIPGSIRISLKITQDL